MKKRLFFVLCLFLLSLHVAADNSVINREELRVLDIGNSYTIDATRLLPLIAKASGADLSSMCLYQCCRGGASYKNWVDIYNDCDNSNTYSISKVLGNLPAKVQTGTGLAGDGKLFRDVLSNEKWDLIIIHQVSTYAPYYSLWNNKSAAGCLDELISIIKKHQPNAELGFIFVHSYWSDYSSNKERSSYDRWQLIANSTKSFCEDYNVDFVIPYGTAIQNLRASSFNNEYDLTRDGTHCGYGLAQYTAACCYYESLIAPRSGISVLGNSARIDVSNKTTKYPTVNVTDENALIAQEAAYLAVKDMYHCLNPELYIFKLTYMVDGEVYQSYDVGYGARITPEVEPTKKGYTFSGWSEIPATMPDKDVTVTGNFTQVDFKIGDVIYEITSKKTVAVKESEQKGNAEIATTIEIDGQTCHVRTIGTKAFKDNKDITSVTIPDGIYTIGYKAFNGCTGLREINIGKDVNSIDYQAFANVGTELDTGTGNDNGCILVNCYAKSVPLTSSDAFDNTPIGSGTLLVEDTSVDDYMMTSPWNRFGTILGIDVAAGIESKEYDSQHARIYDMLGNRIDKLQIGVNIIRMNDGRAKKVVIK